MAEIMWKRFPATGVAWMTLSCHDMTLRNITHLSDEQNQEDGVSDLLPRFKPPASIVTLGLGAPCIRSHRSISSLGIRVTSPRGRPGGKCVLWCRARVVGGLVVITAHGRMKANGKSSQL